MKLIGYTPNEDCIVIMNQADFDGLSMVGKPLINGTQLKYMRKQAGKTLAVVSEATGVSVSFLSDIERGKSNPSMHTYKLLTEFYKTREATSD